MPKLPQGAKRKAVKHGDPTPYLPRLRAAAARHPELAGKFAVLVGLINHESAGFNPNAESWTGAAGLGQFTNIGRREIERLIAIKEWRDRFVREPRIAEELREFLRTEAFDPDLAIEAAALYLASLLAKFNGHVEAALTFYNAGGVPANAVRKAGSHAAALPALLALPKKQRSQSVTYAPTVLADAAYFRAQGIA